MQPIHNRQLRQSKGLSAWELSDDPNARPLLRLVGLPGTEAKYPSQLSGGQQQRIALARALATSPGLLLLDEPLSALDAIVRVHLRQEIRSLQRTLGVTTIMVTHDQEEALSVADRIVVMNHGVIEQVGTPEQVYREPASPFVADFVGRVNVLSGQADGEGRLRVGDAVLEVASAPGRVLARGADIKVYLRPEDVLAQPLPPSSAAQEAFEPGASNVLPARIDKIEFLGAYCLARVSSASLGEQGLTTVLSMNFLAEHGLGVGSALAMRLLPERIRCFEQ
jgi:iron(III) transport system ATP-binding protein